MVLRLLVFIFALNAFAPPAMAVPCEMMNHSDMSSMSHDMHDMSDQKMADSKTKCHMDQNHSCSSIECMTACAANLPLAAVEYTKTFATSVSSNHQKDNLLSLYKIFLPISTPPPLV